MKKVQAAIQGDQVRVSSPSKDELQAAMALLRGRISGVELKFGNYRLGADPLGVELEVLSRQVSGFSGQDGGVERT